MSRVHWLGAGLSSGPGIQRLAKAKLPLTVWNRTLEKAQQSLNGIDHNARAAALDLTTFAKHIQSNDIVVSMLPANLHPTIAKLCIDKNAHFISSSYISHEMQSLHQSAVNKNLCLVNETGLDPGLDHIFAHALTSDYKACTEFSPKNSHRFRSYCGGFPKIPNDFKYKFSWSPLGVLRALKSPARWISQGKEQNTNQPWKALSHYTAQLDNGEETFQAYPNRDSLPFMQEYGFEPNWCVDEFIRGTLRLDGWAQAWQNIFNEVENIDTQQNSERLEALSKTLWEKYAYQQNEADRVVLSVELEAKHQQQTVWYKAYSIDACGNNNGSAMARLVSYTVSLAVESVLEKQIPTGVSAAIKDPTVVNQWLQTLTELGENIVTHTQRY